MLSELATGVRDGAIDPVDLVTEAIRRIESNRHINAVVDLYPDEALETAKRHSRQGALAGLPVLVKDMARVKGKRTTLGSMLFKDAEPDVVDDVVVERLRDAGAIVLGRTNSPEFGATATTVNRLYGATRNPWNTERTPGGSSGGSAAALAAGLVPLATTSDGGGSVRAPASLCGLIGYKPTMGAIGRNLLPRWIGFSTQGATGASVADVLAEASVTLGAARGDFLSIPRSAVNLEPRIPQRVLACRTFRDDVDEEIEEAFERTLNVLARSGMAVKRIDPPSDRATGVTWVTISAAELAESLLHMRDQWDQTEEYVHGQLLFGEKITTAQYIGAQRERHAVAARFDDLLAGDTVIVTPTSNARAWPAEGPMPSTAGRTTTNAGIALNTPDINVTGHPATSVPIGLDNNGVPIGLQVVGPRFRDGLTLGLAQVLEREQPWPLCAPGFSQFGLA